MAKDNVPFHAVVFPATQLGTGNYRYLITIGLSENGDFAFLIQIIFVTAR